VTSIIRVVDYINKWILIVIGLLLSTMAIVIIFQVFSRYILGVSIHWSEELARLLMAYSIFLGAALALRHHKLIVVDFLVDKLPIVTKRILKISTYSLTIIFFIMLFVNGIEMLEKVQVQQSAALQVPMSVFYGCIPLGSFLAIMNAVVVIMELIQGKEGEA
jgi:TRAP-type C4-dicarboxylate transport system permease small subunit